MRVLPPLLLLLLLPLAAAHASFLLSTTSPVTERLREAGAQPDLADLHALFDHIAAAIERRRSLQSTHACNLRGVSWLLSAEASLARLRTAPVDTTCRSQLAFTTAVLADELPKAPAAAAFSVLRTASRALKIAVAAFVRDFEWGARVEWLSGANDAADWHVTRVGQRCVVQAAAAVRERGQWFVRAAATNHAARTFVPDGERAFVEEFVPRDLRDAALSVRRESWPDGGAEANGSTTLRVAGGVAPFAFVPMGVDENPALKEAMRLNEVAVDQATDAITPSNVAILALPMAMSLIPVAFVADLNSCATLLYIVFTDLLASLPFLIKGVELLHTGSARRGETVAFHMGTAELGLLEVWAVECQGDRSFRSLGPAFICVAVAAMGTGLVLELFASRVISQRRRKLAEGRLGEGETVGPFGEALLFEDEYYEEEWAEKGSAEKGSAGEPWIRFVDRCGWTGPAGERDGGRCKDEEYLGGEYADAEKLPRGGGGY